MRLLLVSQHYPPKVNGFALQCADTARGLREWGHEVCVLTGQEKDTGSEDDVVVLRLLTVSPTEDFKSVKPAYLLRQIRRRRIFEKNAKIALETAQKFSPDVVFVWQFNALGFGVLRELQALSVPTVLNVGDTVLCDLMLLLKEDPHLLWRIARRYFYRVRFENLRFAHLIMVSEELKSYYRQHGFEEKQMTVVHNGIDRRHIKTNPPPLGQGNRLLYAGRLHPTKGLDTAIEAVALLNSSAAESYTLDIIGEGSPAYVRQLENRVQLLGLKRFIRFLGPRTRDVLLNLYAEYDILFFPSVYLEPFGLTLVEAMSQGISVVASDRGGPRDIICHMRDGLLVEPGSPSAFAEAVRLLAHDPALRSRIAAEGLQRVKDCFTLEKHLQGTEAVLLGALAGATAASEWSG
jgi:glycosyltransferase involved in cell wall biosynthesis